MAINFSVRPIKEQDIDFLIGYWLDNDPDYLEDLGVDLAKLPSRDQLRKVLEEQIKTPFQEKASYCLIWEIDGSPVGHCNVNPVKFGEEAWLHLHFWHSLHRGKGWGSALLNLSIPYFFHDLQLKRLISEPFAQNTAPQKTLKKTGFDFIKTYTTTPGSINFEQLVARWELTFEKFKILSLTPL